MPEMARAPNRRVQGKINRTRKIATVVSVCLLLIIIGTFVYLYVLDSYPAGSKLSLDWRFHIAIENGATGKNITIPADIGVAGGIWTNHTLDSYGPPGFAPLSTRDTSGTIYVQSVVPRLYVLSEFFAIWGQTYSSTCVGYGSGEYCSSSRPPLISNNVHEYCLSYQVPPIDNGLSWLIVFNTTLPCTSFP